jgi:hypothetical protein
MMVLEEGAGRRDEVRGEEIKVWWLWDNRALMCFKV